MSQVFKQDLTDNSVRPGGLFFVELLMPEQCDMPNRDTMVEVFTKHLGPVDCFESSCVILLVLHLRIIRCITRILMQIFHRP